MGVAAFYERINTAQVDTKGVRTYTRPFLCVMEDLTDRPPAAWGDIPISRYDAYPTDAGAYAISLDVAGEGDEIGHYVATYTYSSKPFDEGNTAQDPTQSDNSVSPPSRPWVISYGSAHYTRIVGPKDLANVAVVNSAGQPFDPPIEVPSSNLTFTVEAYKDLSGFDPTAKQINYVDSINDAGLLIAVTPSATTAWPAKTVRCTEYNCVSVTEQGGTFWKVTISLEFKPTGWQPTVLDAGTAKLPIASPGSPPQKITDDVGNKHDKPIPLDGSGQPLAAGDPFVYLTFKGYYERNFAALLA